MTEKSDLVGAARDSGLVDGILDVTRTLSLAEKYAFGLQKPDGEWCAEFKSGIFPLTEHIFFCQIWGIDKSADAGLFQKFLLCLQNSDGSWSAAPDYPGEVSPTAEAYLALRILGVEAGCPELLRARDFVRNAGGLAKVRILTRFHLAQFGLWPWNAVPQVPPELILLPLQSPVHIYKFWYVARAAIVPLAIIRHHEPIFALPNGKCANNNYLDELWLDPQQKSVPYGRSFLDLTKNDPVGFAFNAADYLMHTLRIVLRYTPIRYFARKQSVNWILEHQSEDGSWFGYLTAMQCSMSALLLEGFTTDDPPIRRALTAMETWMWEDEQGKRIQSSTSPLWDTPLMINALCMSGVRRNDYRLQRAAEWCKTQQIFGSKNEVARYCPDLASGGGFSFQYHNPWIPDVDDTAAVALALYAQDDGALEKYSFVRAAEWALGMQNKDGGWGAFDRNCDNPWLHKR